MRTVLLVDEIGRVGSGLLCSGVGETPCLLPLCVVLPVPQLEGLDTLTQGPISAFSTALTFP